MPELDAERRERLAWFAHEHRPITLLPPPLVSGCECGWGHEVYAHSAHIADALAPLVAEWLAEAEAAALLEAAREAEERGDIGKPDGGAEAWVWLRDRADRIGGAS